LSSCIGDLLDFLAKMTGNLSHRNYSLLSGAALPRAEGWLFVVH
jgi:hypothetical protein